MKLYKKIAKYYDLIFKQDYEKQARIISKLIKNKGKLLDVGCGTGGHLIIFKKLSFKVKGLDDSEEMINVAKKKLPEIIFFKAKMQKLSLKEKFNVITILNRTLLFVKDYNDLKKTIKGVYNQLTINGALIMDLDIHSDYFDKDKSETNYFHNNEVEGSITEEYDLRDDKVLWSINLNIKDNNKIIRLVDNQEFLLINVKKLLKIMNEIGFKTIIYSIKGRKTSNYKQPLIIKGLKFKKDS